MTHIKLFYKSNQIVGFECKKHSGFAESGKDIVCAGISCITQTAVLGLENVAKVDCNTQIDPQKGYLSVQIAQNDINSAKFESAQIILRSMLCGLEDLQEQYPKYLKLEESEL